ncbi:hypothetical protein [Vibrio sp. TBV020]|uniref:hypothetical protein n=1 Tax=Vibrio sp. TBV020 TaxID=3137398 RepID=UPI0038CD836B
MIHSLKNTMIMMLSILLMLVSNYVSSSSTMTMSSAPYENVMVFNGEVCNPPQAVVTTDVPVTKHPRSPHDCCMSMNGNNASHSTMNHSDTDTADPTNCCDSDGGVHTCCTTVSSTVSLPFGSQVLSATASSLALHQSIKIGDTVARLQSILRPPTV